MALFQTIFVARLIFILGFVNIFSFLLLFGTCRCVPGSKLLAHLAQSARYKSLFRYHCYIWWLFWPSVVIHAALAILFFGWPG